MTTKTFLLKKNIEILQKTHDLCWILWFSSLTSGGGILGCRRGLQRASARASLPHATPFQK